MISVYLILAQDWITSPLEVISNLSYPIILIFIFSPHNMNVESQCIFTKLHDFILRKRFKGAYLPPHKK